MKDLQTDRYKELVENLNDAVYTVDVSTLKFTSVNPVGEKLTGYTTPELLNMSVATIVVPEFLPTVQKMITLKRERQSTIYEIEILRKDGTKVPVEISSRALYDHEGKPVEILGVARDITERKLVETNRNVFLSLVTHEIRNPLTSVGLYLELLGRQIAGDDKAESYVSSINQQVKTINQVAADLLDATQMRVGKFSINLEESDLDEIIQEAIEASASPTHVFTREGALTGKVMADRLRLRQVMINLLTNAVKYSPNSNKVHVTTTMGPDGVTVAIRDFGEGISDEDQELLFDIFERTSDSARKKILGHGLGLYICREIITHHKGRLWVESKPGQGATFYFTIPLPPKKQTAARQTAKVKLPAAPITTKSNGRKS